MGKSLNSSASRSKPLRGDLTKPHLRNVIRRNLDPDRQPDQMIVIKTQPNTLQRAIEDAQSRQGLRHKAVHGQSE